MHLANDVIVLSHLRWRFVRQRPQHLLSLCARDRSVYYFEEPIHDDGEERLELDPTEDGVVVVTPHLPHGTTPERAEAAQRAMLDKLLADRGIAQPVLWYYTPMALPFTRHLRARVVVYDCMDELSLFKGAPRALTDLEAQLMGRADVVFTGGHALFEHKRDRHANIHPYPSSVEVPHFARARHLDDEPADQAAIPTPRAGFFGVIDERMDLELIAAVADLRPDVHIVMLGPIAKIDPAALPQRANLHWLGSKRYDELPAYLAGWDVAILPFARNDSTRFISPTKTPEYMAAGRPVVSTSITDVVRPYGERGLARIADDPETFARALDEAIAEDDAVRMRAHDAFLADLSWEHTFQSMWQKVEQAARKRGERTQPRVTAGGSAAAQASGPRRKQEG
jgi:UDP-galactopyranose mutase